MNNAFQNKTKTEKAVKIVHLLSSIGVVAFVLIYLLAKWEPAKNIYFPLMGVVMLCQAYTYRNNAKGLAIASLVVAILVFVVFLAGLFI